MTIEGFKERYFGHLGRKGGGSYPRKYLISLKHWIEGFKAQVPEETENESKEKDVKVTDS